MQSSRNLLVLLTTTMLAVLTTPAGFAFQLKGNTGSISLTLPINSTPNTLGGSLTVTTKEIKQIETGGTDAFLDLLTKTYGNWSFKKGGNLKGGFNVINYYPCGPLTACGVELSALRIPNLSTGGNTGGVGASIFIDYEPTSNDLPKFGKTYWIQMANVDTGGQPIFIYGQQGTSFNLIDTPFSNNPFYPAAEYLGRINPQTRLPSYSFLDVPYNFKQDQKSSYQYNQNWNFELYLVDIPDTSKPEVNIYNGISWGWANTFTPAKTSKTFSGILAAGQTDNYQVNQLTPGSKYEAWTNNDLPSNQCNPNTRLTASSPDGNFAYDDDSSPVGNGFASGLTGTVDNSGILNLAVQPVGGRGEDKGNYELFVNVYDPEDSPNISNGNSGGGGFGKEMGGLTQQNPILPTSTQNGWQTFSKVPGCRWYDPHTTYGFEFQSLEDTLFTEILDFPVGEDTEFAVTVGNILLGTFGQGSSVDFVSLLGHPVNNFKITGINSLIGSTAETAFPIQLAFDKPEGSFQMRAIDVPEPTTLLGALLALAGLGTIKRRKNRK